MARVGNYYEYSGEYGPDGLFFMILAGIVGVPLLSLVYSHAITYIPFIYINIVIIILYGAGTGWLIGKVAIWRKVRNPQLVTLLGFLFGIFAVYTDWVSWIFVYSKYSLLVFSPLDLFEVIKVIAQKGVWSISQWTPTGLWLYLFWTLEALLIIIFSTLTARATLTSQIFCEHCDKWIKEKDLISTVEPAANPGELKTQLEHGDFSTLWSLKKVSLNFQIVSYTQVEIFYCDSCQNLYLLNASLIVKDLDRKGKERESKTSIVENLVISYEIAQKLKQK